MWLTPSSRSQKRTGWSEGHDEERHEFHCASAEDGSKEWFGEREKSANRFITKSLKRARLLEQGHRVFQCIFASDTSVFTDRSLDAASATSQFQRMARPTAKSVQAQLLLAPITKVS